VSKSRIISESPTATCVNDLREPMRSCDYECDDTWKVGPMRDDDIPSDKEFHATNPEEKLRADDELLDIVTEFLVLREDGDDPTVEDYQARYPRYAEDLAYLLADDSDPRAFLKTVTNKESAANSARPVK
jgi:hypothetical protein